MRRREFGARRLDGRSRPCGRNENGMEQEPGARRIFRDRGSMVPASDLHGPRPTTPTSSANAEAAEASLRKALEVAGLQCAKGWELRAATSLARLWCDQGKRDEAQNLLAPVYGWFTEGFDTRDLKEAKALLNELAS